MLCKGLSRVASAQCASRLDRSVREGLNPFHKLSYPAFSSRHKAVRVMARVASAVPPSLGPHICIISSPDLADLLSASSLPPLPQILRSFSPLPQGKTHLLRVSILLTRLHFYSDNQDNLVDTGAPRIFRFALLRVGGNRRGVS